MSENKVLEILKNHRITKQKFAYDFSLSRPTLDDYIEKFINNISIPKDKYQIIFATLFAEDMDHDLFLIKYKKLKSMLKRDKMLKLDELDGEDTDTIIEIVAALKDDVNTEQKILSRFISFLVSDFKNPNGLAVLFCKYFSYLNSLVEYDLTDIDKIYFGNFYDINSKYLFDPNELKDKDGLKFKKFLERKKELKVKNEFKKEKVSERINALLKERIEEAIISSADTDDVDDIINKVLSQISQ